MKKGGMISSLLPEGYMVFYRLTRGLLTMVQLLFNSGYVT
jgi:hypothetical protein